jgi:hypothetical protein
VFQVSMAGLRQHQQRVQPPAAASILLLLAWSHTAAAVLLSQRPGNVLTMILTDCAKYQDWQTIAAAFAWRQSGQPGSVIRVANCNEQDTKKYNPKMLDYVQTHMAKQVGDCASRSVGKALLFGSWRVGPGGREGGSHSSHQSVLLCFMQQQQQQLGVPEGPCQLHVEQQ